MMKTFKHWIQTNHYWKYVEKYGVLGIALDNLSTFKVINVDMTLF